MVIETHFHQGNRKLQQDRVRVLAGGTELEGGPAEGAPVPDGQRCGLGGEVGQTRPPGATAGPRARAGLDGAGVHADRGEGAAGEAPAAFTLVGDAPVEQVRPGEGRDQEQRFGGERHAHLAAGACVGLHGLHPSCWGRLPHTDTRG